MRTSFIVITQVDSCKECPYEERDADGDPYCSRTESDHIQARHTHDQNKQALTETCPELQSLEEERG